MPQNLKLAAPEKALILFALLFAKGELFTNLFAAIFAI